MTEKTKLKTMHKILLSFAFDMFSFGIMLLLTFFLLFIVLVFARYILCEPSFSDLTHSYPAFLFIVLFCLSVYLTKRMIHYFLNRNQKLKLKVESWYEWREKYRRKISTDE